LQFLTACKALTSCFYKCKWVVQAELPNCSHWKL